MLRRNICTALCHGTDCPESLGTEGLVSQAGEGGVSQGGEGGTQSAGKGWKAAVSTQIVFVGVIVQFYVFLFKWNHQLQAAFQG